MKTTRLNILYATLVVVLVAILVPFQIARADMGPKPSMHFEFIYQVDPAPTILSGVQLECQAADCLDAKPLAEMGPQRFGCGAGTCSSMAYGYSDYHRLSIKFSDGKTRHSNVFGKKYFEAYYRVTVREDDLFVEELRGKNTNPVAFLALMSLAYGGAMICIVAIIELPLLIVLVALLIRNTEFQFSRGWYIAAWIVSALWLVLSLLLEWGLGVTLVVEILLALIYARWRKRSLAKLLTVVLLMNLVTQPALWVILSNLMDSSSYWFSLIGEIIIWLVEAGILAVSLRKQAKFWEALALSLVLNLASFGIGLLLPF